jgi:hypothetical protein
VQEDRPSNHQEVVQTGVVKEREQTHQEVIKHVEEAHEAVTNPTPAERASCARSTTETVRTVSDYCLIAKGMTYSEAHGQAEDLNNKYDTPETIQQVKDHDLAYERVCNPPSPKQPDITPFHLQVSRQSPASP